MREGWQQSSIAETCDIVSGQHILSGDYNTNRLGIGYLTGPSDFGKVFPIVTKWTTSPKATASDHDILVTVKGSGVGSVNLWRGDEVAISRQLMAIRPKVAEPWFVFRWMQLNTEYLCSIATGAAIPGLSKSQIGNLRIPLPPLAEQKRIVAILDEAFEAIERAEECHRDVITRANVFTGRFADQLLREVHTQSELRSLGDWGLKVSTGPFGSLLHKSDYIEGGVPLINPVNLVNGEIEVDAAKTVADDALERLQRYRLNAGDVLVARRGEIGRCAPVSSEAVGWLCGTGCFVIRANNNADPRYLAWLVRAGPNHDTLIRASSRATMPSISNKDLAKLEIALPSLSQQHKVVERIDAAAEQAGELRGVHERQLESLIALRQALLTKAFQGALARIQEPVEVVA